MLVCHCHRVNDHRIRQCVREGCPSPGSVARMCGAGTGCGGCAPLVKALVREELSQIQNEANQGPVFLPMAQPV